MKAARTVVTRQMVADMPLAEIASILTAALDSVIELVDLEPSSA